MEGTARYPEKLYIYTYFSIYIVCSVNVLPPIEAGASCFSENSTSDTEASW